MRCLFFVYVWPMGFCFYWVCIILGSEGNRLFPSLTCVSPGWSVVCGLGCPGRRTLCALPLLSTFLIQGGVCGSSIRATSCIPNSPFNVAATPSAHRNPTCFEIYSIRPIVQRACAAASDVFCVLLPSRRSSQTFGETRSSAQAPAKKSGQMLE